MTAVDTTTGEILPATIPAGPTPQMAREAMETYQEISRALLTKDDVTRIGRKEFPNRSAFQKLGNAYRVSTQIIRDEDDYTPDGHLIRCKVTVRATHPDGREAEGDGRCHIQEKGPAADDPKSEHDVHGTAVTRATNRAISNLVAFGAVSAEEVNRAPAATPDGQEYGPGATVEQVKGLQRAIAHLHGSETNVTDTLEQLHSDAGGYLPKVAARAVMLTAARHPTP